MSTWTKWSEETSQSICIKFLTSSFYHHNRVTSFVLDRLLHRLPLFYSKLFSANCEKKFPWEQLTQMWRKRKKGNGMEESHLHRYDVFRFSLIFISPFSRFETIRRRGRCSSLFSRVHATLHVTLSDGRLVCRSRKAYGPNREAKALQREKEREKKKQKSIKEEGSLDSRNRSW